MDSVASWLLLAIAMVYAICKLIKFSIEEDERRAHYSEVHWQIWESEHRK